MGRRGRGRGGRRLAHAEAGEPCGLLRADVDARHDRSRRSLPGEDEHPLDASGSPSNTASTVPSGRLRTQPATPCRSASRLVVSRYQTPCTSPCTIDAPPDHVEPSRRRPRRDLGHPVVVDLDRDAAPRAAGARSPSSRPRARARRRARGAGGRPSRAAPPRRPWRRRRVARAPPPGGSRAAARPSRRRLRRPRNRATHSSAG